MTARKTRKYPPGRDAWGPGNAESPDSIDISFHSLLAPASPGAPSARASRIHAHTHIHKHTRTPLRVYTRNSACEERSRDSRRRPFLLHLPSGVGSRFFVYNFGVGIFHRTIIARGRQLRRNVLSAIAKASPSMKRERVRKERENRNLCLWCTRTGGRCR